MDMLCTHGYAMDMLCIYYKDDVQIYMARSIHEIAQLTLGRSGPRHDQREPPEP